MNLTSKIICRIFLFKNKELKKKDFISFSLKFHYSTKGITKKFLDNNLTFNTNVSPTAPRTIKKRHIKKKRASVYNMEGSSHVAAFNTAEEYCLEALQLSLVQQTSFKPSSFNSDYHTSLDVIHAVKNNETGTGCQHLFLFREGSVVMWNLMKTERKSILDFLKTYEQNSFNETLVENESEIMKYSYSTNVNATGIYKDCVVFSENVNLTLEKYAISNAMALSVRLGTFEANLEQYIDAIQPVTEDLKLGYVVKISRNDVLRKTGQLFALRHYINLNSDLLDTPDFYWDREELENLYQIAFNYYCINKRTKVINEKINHCIELADLLSSHLNDKHHTRLEWMIIVLIMVEVLFEIIHFVTNKK